MVHSYKHDGTLYRSWESPIVLFEDSELIVLINTNITIFKQDYRPLRSKDKALWFFFKKSWYNCIVMERKGGYQYYINIATPPIVEEQAIKYIDYDIDYKVFSNFKWKRLDANEYKVNASAMNYSRNIKTAIAHVEDEIMKLLRQRKNVIDEKEVTNMFDSIKQIEDWRKKNNVL